MTRREAVQALGLGAAALALGGAAEATTVGTGAWRYEWHEDWAKLPAGTHLGNCHMVQEDSQGRILIHHQGGSGAHTGSVLIFDAEGQFIKAWGQQWAAGAHGMQLRKEADGEFLYLATTGQGKIVKTTLDGEIVWVHEFPKEAHDAAGHPCYPDGKGFVPTNIAFGKGGEFYVADGYGKSFIHHYTASGEWLGTWGGAGKADGQLQCPHGIWVDTREEGRSLVLVADRGNERLQWFTLDGRHVKTVASADHVYRHPCHFDQRGDTLLLPGLHGRVSILGADNQPVAILGDNTNGGQRGRNNVLAPQRHVGVFVSPHGACWDRAGNIYVTEWVADGRIIKLRHVD